MIGNVIDTSHQSIDDALRSQVGFQFDSAAGLCVRCRGSDVQGPLIAFIVVVLAVATFFFVRRFDWGPAWSRVGKNPAIRLLLQIDAGMVKVILSTFQIILAIQWNLQILFPVN